MSPASALPSFLSDAWPYLAEIWPTVVFLGAACTTLGATANGLLGWRKTRLEIKKLQADLAASQAPAARPDGTAPTFPTDAPHILKPTPEEVALYGSLRTIRRSYVSNTLGLVVFVAAAAATLQWSVPTGLAPQIDPEKGVTPPQTVDTLYAPPFIKTYTLRDSTPGATIDVHAYRDEPPAFVLEAVGDAGDNFNLELRAELRPDTTGGIIHQDLTVRAKRVVSLEGGHSSYSPETIRLSCGLDAGARDRGVVIAPRHVGIDTLLWGGDKASPADASRLRLGLARPLCQAIRTYSDSIWVQRSEQTDAEDADSLPR